MAALTLTYLAMARDSEVIYLFKSYRQALNSYLQEN